MAAAEWIYPARTRRHVPQYVQALQLADDTLLLPGHNYGHVPNATMGETKKMNAYLRIDDLDTWSSIMGH